MLNFTIYLLILLDKKASTFNLMCNHYQNPENRWLWEILFCDNLSPYLLNHLWVLKASLKYALQYYWNISTTILEGLVFITWSEEFFTVFRLWIAFEKLLSYNYRQWTPANVLENEIMQN